ncbi:Fructoselysine-6-P-deglycase FrlB with duplicated sugar isomerase (SIS) domain [Tropicimonas isoalkanivorans]|uniref:Glutamine--fructose-6-phosphate aminotransferase [isomerizing] n=2 Tax=Tropicimonas isoalkanivorans TaxID=441112 RepID=A0A1I1DK38_9RHOB|nr:Fructoselysine-6-P-deglycase FrlB with duplicated sugar isomerase (SIS) domain [Tropicimonas isoalkanivorans]
MVAASIRETGRVLLLGMGASHAVGRTVEPFYRALGYDAVALPLSEHLDQPSAFAGWAALLTSQSGESAEILRHFRADPAPAHTYGVTLDPTSSLARLVPCLLGAGGIETAFAATRSLTVTLASHAAVLARLGAPMDDLEDILSDPQVPDLSAALARFVAVEAVVTSGRRLRGLADAMALGLTELSRLPVLSLEGGQLRHGPLEMLGSSVGVVMVRGQDETSALVASLAEAVIETGAPLVVFDASGDAPIDGAETVVVPAATDIPAVFRLLPAVQTFMVAFATSRVADVGTPRHSQKITRIE